MIPWEEYRYVVYAREFGWTPAQVDDLPLSAEEWLIPINQAISAEEAKRRQAAAEAARKKKP